MVPLAVENRPKLRRNPADSAGERRQDGGVEPNRLCAPAQTQVPDQVLPQSREHTAVRPRLGQKEVHRHRDLEDGVAVELAVSTWSVGERVSTSSRIAMNRIRRVDGRALSTAVN